MAKERNPKKVQGEGDYEAAKRYDEAAHAYSASGKAEEAARKAKPKNEKEREEMEQAERVGLSHAKGEDPEIKRDR
jgi:hypothetical protein